MKRIFKRIAGTATALLLAASASLAISTSPASALAWSPTATGLDHPGFNVFTGVPDVGNESDFLRGRVSGSTADFTDPVNDACVSGTQYSVRVYVHNGANQTLNNNGTGPGVAHDTKVKVSVPDTTASNLSGTISASNAASVTDTLGIHCSNGKTMALSYVAGSAIEQRMDGSTSPLSDSIVSNGALIGSHDINGDVWGCFEQRVLVFLKVQVKEVPPKHEVTAQCNLLQIVGSEDRKVRISAFNFTAQNVTAQKVVLNWGDNSSVTLTDLSKVVGQEHQYVNFGTYLITATITFSNGETSGGAGTACAQQITFTPNQPPKVTPPPTPPTQLVNTGAGSVTGLVAAVAAIAALAHRRWLARRLSA